MKGVFANLSKPNFSRKCLLGQLRIEIQDIGFSEEHIVYHNDDDDNDDDNNDDNDDDEDDDDDQDDTNDHNDDDNDDGDDDEIKEGELFTKAKLRRCIEKVIGSNTKLFLGIGC